METCDYHTELVKDIAVIKTDLAYIKGRICNHIEEGEKQGGFRDRLLIVEKKIEAIDRDRWVICIISGFLGGLIAEGAPELIKFIIGLLQ